MKAYRWFLSFLLAAGLVATAVCATGCSDDDDDDDDGDDVNAAGSWSGTGTYSQGTRILSFNLNLMQSGTTLSGSYDIQREGRRMKGSVSGYVSGSRVDMDLNPHGDADGRVRGNTLNLDFWEPGFGGGPGRSADCTLRR